MCWGLLSSSQRSVLCKKHHAEVFPSNLSLLRWSSQGPQERKLPGQCGPEDRMGSEQRYMTLYDSGALWDPQTRAGVSSQPLLLTPALLGTYSSFGWGHQPSPKLRALVVLRRLSLQILLPHGSCSFRGNAGLPSWACRLSLGIQGGSLQEAVPCLMPLLAHCSSL